MDFIIACPHCGAYVGVDESTYTDLIFYFTNRKYFVNGEFYCPNCGESSVLDIELEPCDYNIGVMEVEQC